MIPPSDPPSPYDDDQEALDGEGRPEPDDLQFDHAESSAEDEGEAACTACQQVIAETYYEINGSVVCPSCQGQLAAALTEGSGLVRLIKAGALGVVGGGVGAGLYYLVIVLTGYELSLVAIVVGLLVGGAVRMGTGGRGGRVYQLMAVALTYAAITSMVAFVSIAQWDDEAERHNARLSDGAEQEPTTGPADGSEGSAYADERLPLWGEMSNGAKAVVCVTLFIFGLAYPFLEMDGILFIIIGIGLYQAWKMNGRAVLSVTGPYQLAPAPVPGDDAWEGQAES